MKNLREPIKINIPQLTEPIYLERQCWNCKGEVNKTSDKTDFPWDSNGNCEICYGLGVYPTETGDDILKFIKRHGK